MNRSVHLLARIAVFAALAVVVSWACQYVPNVNLIFFIAYLAGYLWGAIPGALVGAIGMGVWSGLNPLGPAAPPLYAAQIGGLALAGLIGAALGRISNTRTAKPVALLWAAGAGIACSVAYYAPVSIVDAWLFQPFWPRLATSAAWSSMSLVANAVAFPLLLPALKYLYSRERQTLWSGAT